MSVFYRALLPTVCAVALAPMSSRAQQELPALSPVQQLPMPTTGVLPNQPTHFGEQVATDGFTTLVTVDDGPAAYTYSKNSSGQWRYQASLAAPAGMVVTGPGALRGNVALVQTAGRLKSAVQVFVRSSGQWKLTQSLPSPDLRSFGRVNNLAIGPDYVVVGDPVGEHGFAGVVRIYQRQANGLYGAPQTLDLQVPRENGAPPSNLWGFNPIALGDTVTASEVLGAVYVFQRSGGQWQYQARLTRSDGLLSTDQYAFSGEHAILDWTDAVGTDWWRAEEWTRFSGGIWGKTDEIVDPYAQHSNVTPPLGLYGRRMMIHTDTAGLTFYERGQGGWFARSTVSFGSCGSAGNPPLRKYELRPYSIVIRDTLAFITCPSTPTSATPFDGAVHVYTLPPLISP
jgi:hypothetical protein